LVVKTAEDTVLRKLLWFREGGLVSEKQWRDIVAVLRISHGTLDNAYLDSWAARLSLTELLARARSKSSPYPVREASRNPAAKGKLPVSPGPRRFLLT
jgi:hypothetical protein